ncbi:MAG: glycosyltransferase family 9 protein [Candidatus Omnitrophica bacterium]|nr:glycosyltransferase family 9 protein [Candidatus Omnitrophota bacterium]
MKSFLIINPFGIGDVLFSTPLIRNIKENLPESKIFYLCNRRAQPILENHPLIDKCFIYERDEFEAIRKRSKISWFKKILSFISEIKKEKIDVALDLSLNPQFGFLSFIAGIKERVGYDYKRRGRFLTKKIKFSGYKDKHVIEYYLDLLKYINLEPIHRKTELFLSKIDKNKLDLWQRYNLSETNLNIVIAPCGGASWGLEAGYKHWNLEKFAQLADRSISELKARVILAGSRQEKEAIEKVERLMSNKPQKAIGLELEDFLAILAKSQLAVVNDGGVLHMAVALGIKTVSIFGPVNEVVYGPYPIDSSKHVVLKVDIGCRPCYVNFRLPECVYNKKCLNDLEVSEVFKAVKSLMDKK